MEVEAGRSLISSFSRSSTPSLWREALNERILLIGVSEQGPGSLRNDPRLISL